MTPEEIELIVSQVQTNYPEIIMGFIALAVLFFLFFIIPTYIYYSIAMQTTAKKLKLKHTWISWIPVANFSVILRMAKFHWAWVFTLLVLALPLSETLNNLLGFAFGVLYVICMYKISERRKFPAWTSFLILIPFFGAMWNLILFGILAWKGK